MVHLLGNLGILIDYGSNEPGSILQHQIHKGRHYVWQDFLLDGNRLIAPVDVKSLPPGEYRLVP